MQIKEVAEGNLGEAFYPLLYDPKGKVAKQLKSNRRVVDEERSVISTDGYCSILLPFSAPISNSASGLSPSFRLYKLHHQQLLLSILCNDYLQFFLQAIPLADHNRRVVLLQHAEPQLSVIFRFEYWCVIVLSSLQASQHVAVHHRHALWRISHFYE